MSSGSLSNPEELPQEKAALNVVVQAEFDLAKQACVPEALAPVIKALVTANANMDVPCDLLPVSRKMA
ncbi:hypothetical protein MVEG_03907 [Podila verticillata NRRL 6337]|nr:hypothetical protein MVEG_03907 [Podila verticillata NRRL 6337]